MTMEINQRSYSVSIRLIVTASEASGESRRKRLGVSDREQIPRHASVH